MHWCFQLCLYFVLCISALPIDACILESPSYFKLNRIHIEYIFSCLINLFFFFPEFYVSVDALISNWNHAEFFPFPATLQGITLQVLTALHPKYFKHCPDHSDLGKSLVFSSPMQLSFAMSLRFFSSVLTTSRLWSPHPAIHLPHLIYLISWAQTSDHDMFLPECCSCSWWLPQWIQSHLVPNYLSSLTFH